MHTQTLRARTWVTAISASYPDKNWRSSTLQKRSIFFKLLNCNKFY